MSLTLRDMHIDLPADGWPSLSFDCPATLIQRLRVRYAEPHRHYHTWSHVLACLDARRRITDASLPEVDLALLFHDAVYELLAADNEARSGLLLVEEGRRAWMNEAVLQRARVLVQATKHDRAPAIESEEACIVLDADLSILGADRDAFDAYDRAIRREFASVDATSYAAGRGAVLRSFLERPSIYATRPAQRLWEASARRNLGDALARLVRGDDRLAVAM
jgi:predicted metal-dependent HD superfamily phosphohydrolase